MKKINIGEVLTTIFIFYIIIVIIGGFIYALFFSTPSYDYSHDTNNIPWRVGPFGD